jgi:hypothetical protein
VLGLIPRTTKDKTKPKQTKSYSSKKKTPKQTQTIKTLFEKSLWIA